MSKEINLFEAETETETDENVLQGTAETLKAISKPKSQLEWDFQERQERLLKQHAKRIIEALFFASSEPLPFSKIREVVDSFHPFKPKTVQELINDLKCDYLSQQRAFRIEEIADGFILRTCEEYHPYIDLLYRNKRTEKLSQAALETLAIIAYKQPITRPQIEAVRGVDSSGIVQSLLDRQLIEAVGKLEAPGRPTLYGITQEFLKHFGLKDLQELPQIKGEMPSSKDTDEI